MTGLTHLDDNFGSVFAIQAANEPMMNADRTPGYGDCRCSLPGPDVLTSRSFAHAVATNSPEELRANHARHGGPFRRWHRFAHRRPLP